MNGTQLRDASGRFLKKGPSQGHPNGPSQGHPNGPSQGHPNGPSQGQLKGRSGKRGGKISVGGEKSSGGKDGTDKERSRSEHEESRGGSEGEAMADESGVATVQGRLWNPLGSVGSITSLSESVLGAKRLYSEVASGSGSGSDTEVDWTRPEILPKAKRGKARGASNMTGARAETRRSREEDVEASFSATLGTRAFRRGEHPSGDEGSDVAPIEVRDFSALGADGLMATAVERLGIITSLVRKTTAFKGGFSAKILRASTDIRDIMDTLVSRNESDEVRRLRADNGRLQREVANMRAEVAALRSGFEEARREVNQAARAAEQRAGAPAEEERLMERLEASIAKMIDGRLAELKTCLPRMVTRPPLAGDSSRVARATRAAIAEASGLSPALLPKRTGMEGRRRESAEEGMEWGPSTSAVPDEFPELPGVEDGPTTSAILVDGSPELPWVEVGRRSKGKGKGKKSKPKPEAVPKGAPSTVPKPTAAPTGAPKSVPKPTAAPAEAPTSVPKESPKAAPLRVVKKLSAPSSSAVILKLQPEAVQNGATYSSALLKAEQEVNLEELGIGSLRIRPSATGARLIEVPGSSSSGKADALASALKVALAGVVDVFRPVKTADFRVTGLNDAATAQRIKAAVAQAGSCTEDQVWVGEIRSDWRGSGSALMRCPVTTAKKLIEAGSLTVGWSRVQLRHLEARPMHCYKCMGKGHTASLCPSQTDRSRLCYRCGEAGHLSASCTAEPRCAVCRDAGKPAGHVMGGRACNPPPIRGKGPSPPPREGRQGEAPVGQMEE
ncbi:uncharacterized protein LOC128676100 [Plodia interpunctella]|uniref:uncharacterized protein LOC128673266 n=1 Tax=Plodia interpunctella TaxID=58824 RepID=UPI003100ABC9